MRGLTLATILITLLIGTELKAQTPTNEMEAKIDSIIAQLTLEEKVAMCHAQSKFTTPGVARLGIPEIWMSDGPHGVRPEIKWNEWGQANWTNDFATAFPALTALAATFNPDLAKQYGIAVGEEARYRRKDVLLGPGVNIYRTPLNGRNFEYMGEDPFLASSMVVPYIHGVQQNGVAACVKHYVLNNQELWRDHINVIVSERALQEIYLPAFKAAVTEGEAWAIMGAYNRYREQQCCHNEMLLNDILKKDWKFDGVVISDWGGVHDTREAALYGLDIEMGTIRDELATSTPMPYEDYYLANPFLKLIREGEIDESVVDDKVRRILRLMLRTNMNPDRSLGRMNNQEHLDVARNIGNEGIVLLKNEDDLFPIDPDKESTIAVIGENATRMMTVGGGSSELKPKKEVSPLEGLKERFIKANIVHAMGYASGPPSYAQVLDSGLDPDSLRKAAVEVASKADIVLFFGGLNKNHQQDCEGDDRIDFGLPFGQDRLLNELIDVNPNTGVILLSGNAVEMPWIEKVKGLMQAWYLGSEAGHAIADVISGDVSPSGKLPFSFPVKLKDNAAHSFGKMAYPGNGKNVEYKEGILVGYRWHDTREIKPLFAFGHGLSYTQFEISGVKTDKKSYSSEDTIFVNGKVTNTGARDGAEVVQVYIGKPESKVARAVKELKGFKKISVPRGQSQDFSISIAIKDLSFYDESISDWNLEKGPYRIYVGNASDHISHEVEIWVE